MRSSVSRYLRSMFSVENTGDTAANQTDKTPSPNVGACVSVGIVRLTLWRWQMGFSSDTSVG